MTPTLSETLFEFLLACQRKRISNGWPETPDWIFCTKTGTRLELERSRIP